MKNTTRTFADYISGNRARILTYHSICDDPTDECAVSPANFQSQMKYLNENSYQVLSVKQFLFHLKEKGSLKKTVVLTFDDGYKDFISEALPVLEQYGFKATVYVVPGRVGQESNWREQSQNKELMTYEDLEQIQRAGHEVGSHSLSHLDLTKLSGEQLRAEVYESKDILEQKLNNRVEAFAYPWGLCNQEVVTALQEAGYLSAVTVYHEFLNGYETDPLLLEREIVNGRDSLSDFVNRHSLPRRVWRTYKFLGSSNKKNICRAA